MFLHEELTIDRLEYVENLPGLTGKIVVRIQYTMVFDNLTTNELQQLRLVHLPIPKPGTEFIPFENLTEEIVINWIKTYDKEFNIVRAKGLGIMLNLDENNQLQIPQKLPWEN